MLSEVCSSAENIIARNVHTSQACLQSCFTYATYTRIRIKIQVDAAWALISSTRNKHAYTLKCRFRLPGASAHAYAFLLLQMGYSDGRFGSLLGSILNVIYHNPALCQSLPMLKNDRIRQVFLHGFV